jgi:hypothetical protein
MGRSSREMRRARRIIEHPAATRGRDASDKAGEYSFGDTSDYVQFTASLLRQSSLKYSAVARAGSMSPTTASNLANGKTHYPRFSTMTGILGALGYETVIRGSAVGPKRGGGR